MKWRRANRRRDAAQLRMRREIGNAVEPPEGDIGFIKQRRHLLAGPARETPRR